MIFQRINTHEQTYIAFHHKEALRPQGGIFNVSEVDGDGAIVLGLELDLVAVDDVFVHRMMRDGD